MPLFYQWHSKFSRVTLYDMQKLYDTPGVHLHHRQAAVVHSEDLPALAPQSRLRGQSFPVCLFGSEVLLSLHLCSVCSFSIVMF